MAADIEAIILGIKRISSAFDEIKPSLTKRILNKTAVTAYHRPPIKEDDKDIKKLVGLIFPSKDLEQLSNRIAVFDIHKPEKPEVYLSIDTIVKNPKNVLLYGFEHLDDVPQKILRDKNGFYLTRKPLLSGGNWMYLEVNFYLSDVRQAVMLKQNKISPINLKTTG